MTRQEKMIKNHLNSREEIYKESRIKFDQPQFAKKCNDTIISKSKKEIFITRHLLTAECTHSIILKDEWFDRYDEQE